MADSSATWRSFKKGPPISRSHTFTHTLQIWVAFVFQSNPKLYALECIHAPSVTLVFILVVSDKELFLLRSTSQDSPYLNLSDMKSNTSLDFFYWISLSTLLRHVGIRSACRVCARVLTTKTNQGFLAYSTQFFFGGGMASMSASDQIIGDIKSIIPVYYLCWHDF